MVSSLQLLKESNKNDKANLFLVLLGRIKKVINHKCLAGSSRTLETFLTSATVGQVTQRRHKISVLGGFQDLARKGHS